MTDQELERLLDLDAPTPSEGFDAELSQALANARLAEDEALDALLGLDQPRPSAGFDGRVQAALARARAEEDQEAPKTAKVLPFVRRRASLWVGLAAAAAVAAFVLPTLWRRAEPVPDQDVAMMAHLELLEAYDELAVLDGIEDADTFDLLLELDEEAL